MVLSDIPISSWLSNCPMDPGERWAGEASVALDDQGSSQAVLDQYVSSFRELLAKNQPETARAEQLHRLTESGPDLGGLDKAPDDLLLDRTYQFGLYAEDILDRLEVLDRRIPNLERCRDRGMVWSEAAEDLLQELRRLRTLHKDNEVTLRRWSDQLCDEFLRRHPELPKLPFEPLDLGPTNSARLPSVL